MTHPKDLSALWREREAAYAAVNSALEPEDDPAWQRYSAVDAAIRAARPMTLSGIAVQARLLQDSITHGAIDQDARPRPVDRRAAGAAGQTAARLTGWAAI
jgi:hypothetical protein